MADLQNFFTEYLPSKLQKNPDLCKEVNAIYQFDLDGFGIYSVDLTGEGEVRQGASDDAGKLSWYAIKLNEFLNEANHKPAEIEKANEDIADEILNGKHCIGGSCED